MSSIICALGKLGDSSAVPTLQKLINVSSVPNLKGMFDQIAEKMWPNIFSNNTAPKDNQKTIILFAYIRFGVASIFFYIGNLLFLIGYFFMLLFTPKTRMRYDVIQEARDVVKALQSSND